MRLMTAWGPEGEDILSSKKGRVAPQLQLSVLSTACSAGTNLCLGSGETSLSSYGPMGKRDSLAWKEKQGSEVT